MENLSLQQDTSGESAVIDEYSDRWALITGASSGIGLEFAHRLAARGMHLVLTARRQEQLEELAADLLTRHGTKTEVVVLDLSEPEAPRKLYDEINARGVQIELLINNAGFSVVSDIASTDRERVMQMVQLNMGALTDLTYLYLPEMMERGHGGIINIASVAAFQPVAYMSAYAASKSYVLHFTEGLWAEARDKGVTVTALCPGTTQTEFFDVAGVEGWLKKHRYQTVDQVVKTGLKALEKKRQYMVSGWGNYLLSLLVRIATRRTVVVESMKYFRPQPQKEKK
ncbi:MAG: short-chain dehydrogenase [Gimesia sp.]|uniref:SDR family oxidoreductase n=1 Tax=Gimesia benthica TaxID=2608982 RepID=A0A6I6AEE5_9PLAN|nr:short-chain dehydrogenase [Gimesia sp.]QGQ23765.1 SDR family oxidoreductase [Gimesia benthica]